MITNIPTIKTEAITDYIIKTYHKPKDTKSIRKLTADSDFYSLLDELIGENTPIRDGDIVLFYNEVINIIESSRKLSIIKITDISDIAQALKHSDTAHTTVLKFNLNPKFLISNLIPILEMVTSDTKISLINNKDKSIDDFEVIILLAS